MAVKTRSVCRFAAQFLALVSLMATVACTTAPNMKSAQEVQAAQFKAYLYCPQGYYSTMLRAVSYAGSDSGFDYVVLTYGDGVLRRYRVFKVKAGDLGLKYHMPVKSTPTDWIDASKSFSSSSNAIVDVRR